MKPSDHFCPAVSSSVASATPTSVISAARAKACEVSLFLSTSSAATVCNAFQIVQVGIADFTVDADSPERFQHQCSSEGITGKGRHSRYPGLCAGMGVPEVLQSLFQAGRCLRYPGVAVDGTVEGFPVIADFVGVVGDITRSDSCAPTDGSRRLKSSFAPDFVSSAGFASGATP